MEREPQRRMGIGPGGDRVIGNAGSRPGLSKALWPVSWQGSPRSPLTLVLPFFGGIDLANNKPCHRKVLLYQLVHLEMLKIRNGCKPDKCPRSAGNSTIDSNQSLRHRIPSSNF